MIVQLSKYIPKAISQITINACGKIIAIFGIYSEGILSKR